MPAKPPADPRITDAQLKALQTEVAVLHSYMTRIATGPQPPSQAQLNLCIQYIYALNALIRTIE